MFASDMSAKPLQPAPPPGKRRSENNYENYLFGNTHGHRGSEEF